MTMLLTLSLISRHSPCNTLYFGTLNKSVYPCTWSFLDSVVHFLKSIPVGNFSDGKMGSLTHINVSQIGWPGYRWSWWAWCHIHGSGRLPGDRNTDGAGDPTSPEVTGLAPSLGLSRASGVTSNNLGSTNSVFSSVESLLAIGTSPAAKPCYSSSAWYLGP